MSNLKLGATLESDDVVRNAKRILTSLKNMDTRIEDLQTTTIQYSRSAEGLKQNIKSVTIQVDKATKATVRFNNQQKVAGVTFTNNTRKIQEQEAALRRRQEAQQRLTRQQQANATDARDFLRQASVIRADATPDELLNFRKAQAQLVEFVRRNNVAANNVRQIWQQVTSGNIQLFQSKTLNDLQSRIVGVQKRFGKLGDESDRALSHMQREALKSQKQMGKLNQSTNNVLINWRSFVRLVTIQALHILLANIHAQLSQAASAAKELSIRIAEIRGLDDSGVSAQFLAEQLREVSAAYDLDQIDLAESAYETLSNQIAEGAEAFDFLNTAAKFAVTTVATNEQAVNLLSSAINAFGKDVNEAERLSAQFFKIIDLGRVRAEELADRFGRVAVPANQLGVTFEELGAFLTVTTRNGIKAEEAMTLVRNVMFKLIRPTDAMKGLFRELGVNSGEAAIQTFGLAGLLQELEDRTRGSSTEIGEYFGRIRATSGVMNVMGEDLDEFNKDLEQIKNSTEAYGKANELIMESSGKRVGKFTRSVKNFFLNDLGGAIIEITANFLNFKDTLVDVYERETLDSLEVSAKAWRKYTEQIENNLSKTNQNILDSVQDTQTLLQQTINQAIAEQQSEYNDLEDSVVNNFKDLQDESDEYHKEFIKDFKESSEKAQEFRDKLFDTERKFFERQLGIDLLGEDPEEQVKIIEEKIKDLEGVTQRTARTGDEEAVKEQLELIFSLNEQIQDIENEQLKEKIKKLKTDEEGKDLKEEEIDFLKIQRLEEERLKDEREETEKLLKSELSILRQLALFERSRTESAKSQVDLFGNRLNLVKAEELQRKKTGFSLTEALDSDEAAQEIQKQIDTIQNLLQVKRQAGIQDKETRNLLKEINQLEQVREGVIKTQQRAEAQRQINEDLKQQVNLQRDLRKESERALEQRNELLSKAQQLANASGLDITEFDPEKLVSGTDESFFEFRKLQEAAIGRIRRLEAVRNLPQLLGTGFDPGQQADKTRGLQTELTNAIETGELEQTQQTFSQSQADLQRISKSMAETEKSLEGVKSTQESSVSIHQQVSNIIARQAANAGALSANFKSVKQSMEALRGIGLPNLGNTVQNQATGTSSLRTHTDSVPAMLTPGEFVMNAKSTKRFYSQLLNMNTAKPYNQGGPVTNISGDFGGITIQSTGNTQQDVLSIARGIKKELRRGTISFKE